jgi:hypothetical protein
MTILPAETDAILVIDPNGVLAFAILPKRVKLVAWWCPQVSKLDRCIDHSQLPTRDRNKIGGEAFRTNAIENRFP